MTVWPPDLYFYRCWVKRVVDADTIDVELDYGWGEKNADVRLRLYRIDAFEIRGTERPKGLAAKAFVEALLPPGDEIIIRSHKDERGKFGRPLADVYLPDGRCLNDLLVTEGHAIYRKY